MGLMYLAANLRKEGKMVKIFDADIEARILKDITKKILEKIHRYLKEFSLLLGTIYPSAWEKLITPQSWVAVAVIGFDIGAAGESRTLMGLPPVVFETTLYTIPAPRLICSLYLTQAELTI